MLKNINGFFSIENKDYKKYNKNRLHQNSQIEKYRSEIM